MNNLIIFLVTISLIVLWFWLILYFVFLRLKKQRKKLLTQNRQVFINEIFVTQIKFYYFWGKFQFLYFNQNLPFLKKEKISWTDFLSWFNKTDQDKIFVFLNACQKNGSRQTKNKFLQGIKVKFNIGDFQQTVYLQQPKPFKSKSHLLKQNYILLIWSNLDKIN